MIRKIICVGFLATIPLLTMPNVPTETKTLSKSVVYADTEQSIEEMIVTECEIKGIPTDIPLAIARLETGNFTSNAYLLGNNVGGLSVNEIPLDYNTKGDGVKAFVGNLADNYFNAGLTTIEDISKKYCPVNHVEWAKVVTEIVGEVRNGEFV